MCLVRVHTPCHATPRHATPSRAGQVYTGVVQFRNRSEELMDPFDDPDHSIEIVGISGSPGAVYAIRSPIYALSCASLACVGLSTRAYSRDVITKSHGFRRTPFLRESSLDLSREFAVPLWRRRCSIELYSVFSRALSKIEMNSWENFSMTRSNRNQ